MKEIVIRGEDDKVESVVQNIKNSGIKIESIDEVISFDEAKKRIAQAVEEYRSGRMTTYTEEEFDEIMKNYWAKYEN